MAPLCILAIPVTVVQPRFVNGGKARERSDRAREIFSKFVYETGIFCTLDTIIRVVYCTGIDQFPNLFLFFILFLMKVSGKHFPFSLSFFLFSPSKKKKKKKKNLRGGGATAPIAPPGYATGPLHK